jgi:acyl-coenzyme A thioesterase PaaI-like protein
LAAALACIGGRALHRTTAVEDAATALHTASLHVSYVSAAVEQDVQCETRLLRSSSSISFVESEIYGADGVRIANTQATLRYRLPRETAFAEPERLEELPAPAAPHAHAFDSPIFDHLGIEIEEMVGGRSRLRLAFREELAEEAGFHEAALLALFDAAGATSSHAAYGDHGRPMRPATIALQALGLAPSFPAEDVVAVSRCVSRDGDFLWNDVRVAVRRTGEVLVRGGLVYRIAPSG